MKKADKCSQLPPAALKNSSWSRVENFILKTYHTNFHVLLVTLLLLTNLQYLNKNYLSRTSFWEIDAIHKRNKDVCDFPIFV